MNSPEKQREFRENLREKNPELAERYEQFKALKSKCYTSGWAHAILSYEDVRAHIENMLSPNELKFYIKDTSHQVARVWVRYTQYKTRTDSTLCLDALGVKNLYWLVGLYKEYCSWVTENQGAERLENFVEFLKIKLEKKYPNINMEGRDPYEMFPLSDSIDEGDLARPLPTTIDFYFEQYSRLERERQIGTPHSESVFLPLLKMIAKCDRDIVYLINLYTKPTIYLTFSEIEDALVLGQEEDFFSIPDGAFGGDGSLDIPEKGDVLEDLRSAKEELSEDFEVEILEDPLVDFFKSQFGYGHNLSHSLYTIISENLGKSSAIGRLKFEEMKLREAEKKLESALKEIDIGGGSDQNRTDVSMESIMRTKMALYLLSLYRRHRQEINELTEKEDGLI